MFFSRLWRPPPDTPVAPGQPGRYGTAGDFTAPAGQKIDADRPHGYYVDLRSKAESTEVPPPWWRGARTHVVRTQWGLGCYEHYLHGEGDEWLDAAIWLADWLIESQETTGTLCGGWTHDRSPRHSYRLPAPWLSGMAQGQAASLLVRVHDSTGDERYAEAARAGLLPMGKPAAAGGVAAELGGGRIPEEYPTDPPSHVLNGALFGLWGLHDVHLALGDEHAGELATEGLEAMAAALPLYDSGSWSRYDLYPHPVTNCASPMYHRLHIDQLRATAILSGDQRFDATAERFARYAASRASLVRAYGHKVLFRLVVPRNRHLARRLPWAPDRSS